MTSLDTLLERLDKLDAARTKSPWSEMLIEEMIATSSDGKDKEDAAFIVVAVDTNATLREVIRVQSVALKSMAISDSYAVTPDGVHDVASNLHWNQMTARAALQRVEEIVKCGM